MPRLTPLALADVPADLAETMRAGEALMGFTPNDALTMARNPALLRAMFGLVQAIYGPSRLPSGLKRLIGTMTSAAAGCQYCEAHATHGAVKAGVDDAKLTALWDYERSDLFDARERAALRVAQLAGQVPNAVTDVDFAALEPHFDEDETLEIVAVIALFGFLNRWNSTLATDLEATPMAAAKRIKQG